MGRRGPQPAAGSPRDRSVGVAVTAAELATIDEERGAQSRSSWARGKMFPAPPTTEEPAQEGTHTAPEVE